MANPQSYLVLARSRGPHKLIAYEVAAQQKQREQHMDTDPHSLRSRITKLKSYT